MAWKWFKSEVHRKQNRKNWIVLGILVAFILLVYLVSITKMLEFWNG